VGRRIGAWSDGTPPACKGPAETFLRDWPLSRLNIRLLKFPALNRDQLSAILTGPGYQMRLYPLRQGITREEFDRLVTDLYYRLAAQGLNPSSNLTVEDQGRGDGTTQLRFALFISETAAQILENKLKGRPERVS
jgi:hypothetical protein